MPYTYESCERIRFEDPATGVRIIQLTSFPVIHWLGGCSGQGIAADGKTILLFADRTFVRNAPRDLYRVESDGSHLALLAREPHGAVVSADRRWVYAGRQNSLIRIPLDGGDEEELARLDGYTHIHVSADSPDGRHVFGQGGHEDGTFDVMRLDLGDGSVARLLRASYLMPVELCGKAEERLLASVAPIDEAGASRIPWGYWSFTYGGDDFAAVPFVRSTNHYVPLRRTGEVATTAHHPGNAIDVAAPGDAASRVLAHGSCFWHITADATGEWIVADTNWPDVGLQLVHAASGRFRTLCATGASGGHPQWTHAHPCLSPAADYVLYTSDRTGIQQVYLAEIPETLKAALRDQVQ